MSTRILTLFGEEIIPEEIKAVGKSRAKKKETGTEEIAETVPADAATEQMDDTAATPAAAVENADGPGPCGEKPVRLVAGVTGVAYFSVGRLQVAAGST